MSPSFHRAEDVADEIVDRMSRIDGTGAFETRIGLKVYQGRTKIDDNMVPCCVLIEAEDVVLEQVLTKKPQAKINQRYVLVGYDNCDPDNPNTTAHKIIRDFKRVIFPDSTLNANVLKANYRGRDIGPRPDGVPIVMGLIQIDVEYMEELSNP